MIAYGFNAKNTSKEWTGENYRIELKRMWKRINTDEEAGYCIEGHKYQDYYIVKYTNLLKPVVTSKITKTFFGKQYESEEREYKSRNAAMNWIRKLLTEVNK